MINEIKMQVIKKTNYALWLQLNWALNLYPSVARAILRKFRMTKESAIRIIKAQPYYEN